MPPAAAPGSSRRGRAGTPRRPLLVAVLLTAAVHGCTGEPAPREHVRDFDSGPIVLDKVYRSMQGPVDEQLVRLGKEGEHETVWITGVDVEPLDAAGNGFAEGQEFICHVNISHPSREAWMQDFQARRASGRALPFNWFTLVQGHYSLRFPEGFAVPGSTDQIFRLFSMAQMQDPAREPFDMRIRSRVHYVYARDLERPMVPLSKFSWDVRVAAPYDPKAVAQDHTAGSCAEHDPSLAKPQTLTESPGHTLGGSSAEPVLHFAVPPGRHEYRTRVDGASKIPFPTTAHHFSAHLHVYGVSLELIDATSGETIFRSDATANGKHTGIAEMTSLATSEGVRIYPDHTYELVAVYDNPTDQPIDAMAVVYVYYRDEPPPAASASL